MNSNKADCFTQPKLVNRAYEMLTSDDDGRLCRDIPESACKHQPKNFFTHAITLSMTKSADGLLDPKLVLSWLLTSLGASPAITGLLVPVREAGALLPQLFIAEWVRQKPIRKWVWISGSLIQGLCVLGMIIAAVHLSANHAAITIVCLLALLAIARSFCSVSYKDILGKTVSKSTRGTSTGTAGTIASVTVIGFGLGLATGVITLSQSNVLIALSLAALLWIVAALLFTQVAEEPGATDGGENGIKGFLSRLVEVWQDKQLRYFIAVRGCLTVTALAPPFILMLSSYEKQLETLSIENFESLGLMILASATAGLLSSFIWGKLADRSSRKVLMLASVLASLAFGSCLFIMLLFPDCLNTIYTLPLLLFLLMVAYQGVRLGRATHLVDMAPGDKRAHYTAVSNAAIGVLMLAGSVFGWLADKYGLTLVLSLFFALCLCALLFSFRLKEVQRN